MQLLFVTAQQLGDMAAFDRSFDKLHSSERARHHPDTMPLHQGVLDQCAPVFGQKTERIVQDGFARLPVEGAKYLSMDVFEVMGTV